MTTALSGNAASFKLHVQEEITTAIHWVDSGSVRDDSSFKDGNGHLPFQGCVERLTERTKEMALFGERWEQDRLAYWCKNEADAWFEGFPDDTIAFRMDFTASLFSLAKTVIG
ncbi:MAG TPA: hypothetical protein ENH62_09785 [Marinobacter sp.]|uniref:Uncharacterized protein n=1 Tax=marine sediment metagenome TaxID=412755 RepID=A0A0F9TD26_9ZZZZ|nr:hypothetical protein [Marinobacter sp.]